MSELLFSLLSGSISVGISRKGLNISVFGCCPDISGVKIADFGHLRNHDSMNTGSSLGCKQFHGVVISVGIAYGMNFLVCCAERLS